MGEQGDVYVPLGDGERDIADGLVANPDVQGTHRKKRVALILTVCVAVAVSAVVGVVAFAKAPARRVDMPESAASSATSADLWGSGASAKASTSGSDGNGSGGGVGPVIDNVESVTMWCERKSEFPFNTQFFLTLAHRMTTLHGGKGAGVDAPTLAIQRLILRVIDPSVFPGEYSFDHPYLEAPTLAVLLHELHNSKYQGEVYVLPWVEKASKWGLQNDIDAVQASVEWVYQVNSLAEQLDILPITGMVFETEGSGYTTQELFTTAYNARTELGMDGTTAMQRVDIVTAPQTNVYDTLLSLPFDEGIAQMYNLVSDSFTMDKSWQHGDCTCAGHSSDCGDACQLACKIMQKNGACSRGKPVSNVCVVDATVDKKLEYCDHIVPASSDDTESSAYLAAVEAADGDYITAGTGLAAFVARYIDGNSAGVREWPSDADISVMFSLECTGKKCQCPLIDIAGGCGTIPAFGTWTGEGGIDGLIAFIRQLRAEQLEGSIHRVVLFDYNYVPTSFWND